MPSTTPPKAGPSNAGSLGFFGFRAARGDAGRAGGVFALFWDGSGAGSGGVGSGGVCCVGWLTPDMLASRTVSRVNI